MADAEADFTDRLSDGNDDWKKKLKYMSRSTLLQNTVYNLNLILANDPDFRNFAFNEMANRIQVTGAASVGQTGRQRILEGRRYRAAQVGNRHPLSSFFKQELRRVLHKDR
ncbi:MAG: hypothetical protein ACOX41_01325 [Anaerovoracaceae bacterium]